MQADYLTHRDYAKILTALRRGECNALLVTDRCRPARYEPPLRFGPRRPGVVAVPMRARRVGHMGSNGVKSDTYVT
jgi:hypothetical protein